MYKNNQILLTKHKIIQTDFLKMERNKGKEISGTLISMQTFFLNGEKQR